MFGYLIFHTYRPGPYPSELGHGWSGHIISDLYFMDVLTPSHWRFSATCILYTYNIYTYDRKPDKARSLEFRRGQQKQLKNVCYIYVCIYIYISMQVYIIRDLPRCPQAVARGRFRLTMRPEVVVSLLTIVTVDASQLQQRMIDAAAFGAVGSNKMASNSNLESIVNVVCVYI